MTREAKAELRERILAWRRGLTPEDIRTRSLALAAALLGWPPLGRGRCVMAYAALRREPDTRGLIAALQARGVRVTLPQVAGTTMSPIPAPGTLPTEPSVDVRDLDVVLVPGLAFDAAGHRLGRGGGHYDRFLARLRPDCLCVGMCFEGQIVAAVPTDTWDQPVDVIATEAGVREGGAKGAARP